MLNKKKYFLNVLRKNEDKIPDVVLRQMFPHQITINPTTYCNINCKACPHSNMNREKGNLELGDFKTIVNKLPNSVKKIGLYFMGEPLMNENIFDMISHANKRNFITTTETNSVLVPKYYKKIVDSGLSKINLSFDGFTQETLSKYHVGSDIDKVKEGIERLVRYRDKKDSDLKIVVSTLMFSFVEEEIEKIEEFLEGMDVIHKKSKPIVGNWGSKKIEPIDDPSEEWNRNSYDRGIPDYCPGIFSPIVTWKGDLVSCCLDVEAKHKFGNLLEEDFDDIYWKSELREKMFNRELDICKNCKLV